MNWKVCFVFFLLFHFFSLFMGEGGGPSRVQGELESLFYFLFLWGKEGVPQEFQGELESLFCFFLSFYGGIPQEFKVNWKVCFVNDFCDGLRLFDISFCNLHASSQTVIIY
jgi:hypothetical protein